MHALTLLSCVFLLVVTTAVVAQDGFATLAGGTTGGAGGPTVNVATQAELIAAVTGNDPKIVRITAHIPLTKLIRPGSNKSILGANANAGVSGSGFYIRRQKNVIIRGLKIFKSVAPDDGVSIDETTHLWVDHNEFYSDKTHGKNYYDGLLDAKHAADYITVSWNKFHTHYKCNLIGHLDNNAGEDTGKLRITYHHNWFLDCESRLPSLRFGTAHLYNNLFENVATSGINSRMGAQVLVETNVFINTKKPLTTNLDSNLEGYAVERNNHWGDSAPEITKPGSFINPPYSYTQDSLGTVAAKVRDQAGATIFF